MNPHLIRAGLDPNNSSFGEHKLVLREKLDPALNVAQIAQR